MTDPAIEVNLPATRASRTNVARFTPMSQFRGNLAITQDGLTTEYRVIEMNCRRGREFRLSKVSSWARPYTVYLPSDEAEASGDCWPCCDCPSGKRGRCKHREAIQAVVDRGAFSLVGVN